jgi:hypothetical protein
VLLGLQGSEDHARRQRGGGAGRKEHRPVAVVDLDVAHPGFRGASTLRALGDLGVAVVRQGGADSFADVPVLLSTVRRLIAKPDQALLLDVGSDDRSALALAELEPALAAARAERVLVLNFCRPFTDDVEGAVSTARAIEQATGGKLDSLACNTHLCEDTCEETIRQGIELTQQTACRLGLKVWAVAAEERVLSHLPDAVVNGHRALALQPALSFEPDAAIRVSPRAPVGPTFG